MPTISPWSRGIRITTPTPTAFAYLWFYEWNLFEATRPGQHTPGHRDFTWDVSEREGHMTSDVFSIDARASDDHIDIALTITNRTSNHWPEIASIIPCFNPGKQGEVERTRTWFVSKDGLSLLNEREIHFNQRYRKQIDREADEDGQYIFSEKWPTDPLNAEIGAIIRESDDGSYVAGIVWDDFLSAQGHNPWTCMHLSVRAGALAPDESVTRRGRIYLFNGTAQDCLDRCRSFLG
jgi:hypothetical protein